MIYELRLCSTCKDLAGHPVKTVHYGTFSASQCIRCKQKDFEWNGVCLDCGHEFGQEEGRYRLDSDHEYCEQHGMNKVQPKFFL